MAKYKIISKGGSDYGEWPGDTPEEALIALHRYAGYSEEIVWINANGDIQFKNGSYMNLLGGANDWIITGTTEYNME